MLIYVDPGSPILYSQSVAIPAITWTLSEKSRTRGAFWYLGIEHEIEIMHDKAAKTVGRLCREKVAKCGTVTIARRDGIGWEPVHSARFDSKPKTAAKAAVVAYCG